MERSDAGLGGAALPNAYAAAKETSSLRTILSQLQSANDVQTLAGLALLGRDTCEIVVEDSPLLGALSERLVWLLRDDTDTTKEEEILSAVLRLASSPSALNIAIALSFGNAVIECFNTYDNAMSISDTSMCLRAIDAVLSGFVRRGPLQEVRVEQVALAIHACTSIVHISSCRDSAVRALCCHMLIAVLDYMAMVKMRGGSEQVAALKSTVAGVVVPAAIRLADDPLSVVRLASARVLRSIVVSFGDSILENGDVLARLCFLRYFGTDPQRFYSQATWKILVAAPSLPRIVDAADTSPPQFGSLRTSHQPSECPDEPCAPPLRPAPASSSVVKARASPPTTSTTTTCVASARPSAATTESVATTGVLQHGVGIIGRTPGGNLIAPSLAGVSAMGPRLVAMHLATIVPYYVAQLQLRAAVATNAVAMADAALAVEAAAHCTAELAQKVATGALLAYASNLLSALLSCCGAPPSAAAASSSPLPWTVRDACIVASVKLHHAVFVYEIERSRVVATAAESLSASSSAAASPHTSSSSTGSSGPPAGYQSAVSPAMTEALHACWLSCTADADSGAVRDHAAMAVGVWMTLDRAAALQRVCGMVRDRCGSIEPQISAHRITAAATAGAVGGISGTSEVPLTAHGAAAVASAAVSSSVFAASGGSGSASSHPSAPLSVVADIPSLSRSALIASKSAAAPLSDDFSATALDGCVCLLREVSLVDASEGAALLPPLLHALVGLAERPGPSVAQVRAVETLFRQLPDIAAALGKPVIKRNLDDVLSVACACLRWRHADVRSAAFAAGDCLASIARLVGVSILAGRLTPEHMRAVTEASEATVRLRPMLGLLK